MSGQGRLALAADGTWTFLADAAHDDSVRCTARAYILEVCQQKAPGKSSHPTSFNSSLDLLSASPAFSRFMMHQLQCFCVG